jgi:hypothetical protein
VCVPVIVTVCSRNTHTHTHTQENPFKKKPTCPPTDKDKKGYILLPTKRIHPVSLTMDYHEKWNKVDCTRNGKKLKTEKLGSTRFP